MKVMKEGQLIERSYEGICEDLGFDPSVHFVKVTTRHTIGFTVGKPNEIGDLKRACRKTGYWMTRNLENF